MPSNFSNFTRSYYGPTLSTNTSAGPQWTNTPSRPYTSDKKSWTRLATVGAFGVGIFGAGYIPTKKGRLWDHYVRGIRAVEEYSPGGILRTFQLSNLFSRFETASQNIDLPSSLLKKNLTYTRYLANLIGHGPGTLDKLKLQGAFLKEGSLYYGAGDLALKHAGAIRSPSRTASWMGKAWAANAGVNLHDAQKFFVTHQPHSWDLSVKNPMADGMAAQIIGGQTRLGVAANYARATATEWVGRFNRLLENPLGIAPLEKMFGGARRFAAQKLGVKSLSLAVKDGTAGQMMMRLVGKYGLALPAAYMGYKTLDWMTEGSRATKGTIFEEGLTIGLGTAAARTHIMASRAAEKLGLHSYREKQEEIAPGSTSLTKLAAFPIMGMMGASFGLYGIKAGMMGYQQHKLGIQSWQAREIVEDQMKVFSGTGILARFGRKVAREDGIFSDPGRLGNIWRRMAERAGNGELRFPVIGKGTPSKIAGALGFAAGAALVLPFLPGALIPGTRPGELEDIYSGRKEVAVRRGRWWEAGSSPWEGGNIAYYRPHMLPMMRMHARDTSLWGEDRKKLSPFSRWWKSEFTYELEKRHFKDYPAPLTSTALEEVPLIGPMLSATIGKFIKPPLKMHRGEIERHGGNVALQPNRAGQRISTEIGEQTPGKPVSPYNLKGTAGEQVYRMTEMAGLPGFMVNVTKEAISGTGDFWDQQSQLETSRKAFGFGRNYWDLEVGGGLFSTEALRRLYPHRRNQIPQYNPIKNSMPDWMPGPGEKSEDFQHGSAYSKIPYGELRLPGVGYQQRYPELKGIGPNDYPLIHKWKILSDVAPYSSQYGDYMSMIRSKRKSKNWSRYEEDIYTATIEQIKARKNKKNFKEYEYLSSMGGLGKDSPHWGGDDSTGMLTALNEIHKKPKSGIFKRLFGGYWEALSHNAETAFDQMTPASPGAKLVHQRTAIEDYERTNLYGTSTSFWNHPYRDFFRPTFYRAAQDAGYEGVPEHIQGRRNLEGYFDVLKYIKSARLSNIARNANDNEAVRHFEAKKDQTLFGINPYTMNYTSIFNALPRRDRDYFNAFRDAGTEDQRKRILQMVPENEKPLYAARWKLVFADEVKKAKKNDALTEKQTSEAEKLLGGLYVDMQHEGMPTSQELQAEYIKTRQKGESYADWYRRTHLLTQMKNIPGPDWVGWHPMVDLEDIKMKVVQNHGEDIHNYDMWESQEQTLVNKPYINQETIEPIINQTELSQSEVHDRIDKLLLQNNLQGDVFVRQTMGTGATDIDIKTDNSEEEADAISQAVK